MNTHSSTRLRGVLKMIASSCNHDIDMTLFPFDKTLLLENDMALRNRRRKRRAENNNATIGITVSFDTLISRHRYTCFIIIQSSQENFYSTHALDLRRRLAQEYHDSLSLIAVFVQGYEKQQGDNIHDSVYCQGTGFAAVSSTSIPLLLTLLNVSELPAMVIVDTTTGRRLSRNASLAVEWNHPHQVINAWQRGSSGLSCMQHILAITTCQSSSCTIM